MNGQMSTPTTYFYVEPLVMDHKDHGTNIPPWILLGDVNSPGCRSIAAIKHCMLSIWEQWCEYQSIGYFRAGELSFENLMEMIKPLGFQLICISEMYRYIFMSAVGSYIVNRTEIRLVFNGFSLEFTANESKCFSELII